MASLTMRCGTDLSSVHCRHLNHLNRNRIGAIGMRMNSRSGPRISAAASGPSVPCVPTMPMTNRPSDESGALFSEKVDEWMRGSAVEIVKNLREAPLFVQVYASNNGAAAPPRLQTEKAVAEEWPVVERRWKDGTAPAPDGLILVEELQSNEDQEEEEGTKAWGVVVQGKGSECGPACYLLKTSRVGSGLGLCSTHFCLMKVKNFRESALSQLTNCWLLK
ncbi:uncharacterized protein LOC127796326 [Diospyros lotus]|uniref:uncharacterized protein LOC127796326 n=1 Tax=Diospyros lotus TaxID=55363 RepID=UPI002258DDEA|nr:uncharacterized protein LOC127796326 [Diospyros lotus]